MRVSKVAFPKPCYCSILAVDVQEEDISPFDGIDHSDGHIYKGLLERDQESVIGQSNDPISGPSQELPGFPGKKGNGDLEGFILPNQFLFWEQV